MACLLLPLLELINLTDFPELTVTAGGSVAEKMKTGCGAGTTTHVPLICR